MVRRTVVSALVLGAAGAAAAVLFHQPLVAPGIFVGLGLAIANHRVFQVSALRFSSADGSLNRRPFASSVLARLGACTAVAIGLLVVLEPMGWGVIAGLALFQFMMMANALGALLRYQREQLAGAGPAAEQEGEDA